MATPASNLPSTHRALVLTSRDQPLEVKTIPVPKPTPGSTIVQILAAGVLSYSGEVYAGKRPYPFPTPMVPGMSAVGRIVAVGPDSTLLQPGQLVLVDSTIRSRDDSSHIFLLGLSAGSTQGSSKLMEGEWRDGTYAEYAKLPLENCFPVNESAINKLNYSIDSLVAASHFMVPYGGLSDINVVPGETVIVAPATGPFGGSAVKVALAMGAKVLAMGRNTDVLNGLAASSPKGRVIPIPLTADAERDGQELAKHKPIDAYFDISPPHAAGSHHVKTCMLAVRHAGRVSLMGGLKEDVPIPHNHIMRRNITIQGTWMYTPDQARRVIKLVEAGFLKLDAQEGGVKVVGKFPLEKWSEAFDCAAKNAGPGEYTVLAPQEK